MKKSKKLELSTLATDQPYRMTPFNIEKKQLNDDQADGEYVPRELPVYPNPPGSAQFGSNSMNDAVETG